MPNETRQTDNALAEGTCPRAGLGGTAASRVSPAIPRVGRVKRSGTILVVDDEQVVRDVCSALLRALGFDVLTATDGYECLAVYQEHRDKIVAVLLDITMPRMDGTQALQELKRINPEVRVLMTSGYSEVDALDRYAGIPSNGFIEKPFRLDTLWSKLQAVLEDES